ncbi:histidine--tRNA ligase [Salmonella enterica subsp. enterica serovar Poona]|nr:histidine--tRNA ligase [Salmonella enterica subsp. enterica serovar Poona]HEB6949276.1 histidine--tRNA ligase [Salmonella enterica subsp. enterica serovar Hvittingfoss]
MFKIQSVRGMKDILPGETPLWQWCEEIIRQVTRRYGYREIRLPVLEPVSLFERAVGESTDIVSKEMYDFRDKSGEHITLRPEGTSGCVRAIIEHNLCYRNSQRLWYSGPMFRYERPQKGRLRQFTQFGVEAFGLTGPDIDVELILLVRDIFRELGVAEQVTLQINSLGTGAERQHYRRVLVDWFIKNQHVLDEDSQKRLHVNPLRILDSKNPDMQEMIAHAPALLDYLGEESKAHFETFCRLLDTLGVRYEINTRLVRGLDYYTRTVFEWVTVTAGAQGTVCGGGRYDGLVELFDKNSLPAAGFAIGLERLLLLVQSVKPDPVCQSPDIVITAEGISAEHIIISDRLRNTVPGLNVSTDFSGSKIKRQHENAINSGCQYILTVRSDHILSLWKLSERENVLLTTDELIAFFRNKPLTVQQ